MKALFCLVISDHLTLIANTSSPFVYCTISFGYRQPTFISHLLIGLSPFTFLEDGRLLSEKVKTIPAVLLHGGVKQFHPTISFPSFQPCLPCISFCLPSSFLQAGRHFEVSAALLPYPVSGPSCLITPAGVKIDQDNACITASASRASTAEACWRSISSACRFLPSALA